jgi:hypothetical protein
MPNNYGVKISKTGVDVKIADPADLIYSSKWTNFKIHSILSGSVTTGETVPAVYSSSIDNPLSYPPLFMAFFQDANNTNNWYPASGNSSITPTGTTCWVEYNSSNNKFHLFAAPGDTNTTFNFKVVVFIDILSGTSAKLDAIDNYGMKISKTGKTTSDKDTDMSFYSKWGNLTVFKSGTVTDSGGVASITHDLGYHPICISFMTDTTDNTKQLAMPAFSTEFYITNTTLEFTQSLIPPTNVTYKYIIFNERFL